MSRATRATSPQITAENGVSSVAVKKASSSGNAVAGASVVTKTARRRPRASSPGTTVSATTESSGSTVVSPRRVQSPRGSVSSSTPRGEKIASTKQPATNSRPVTVQKVSSNTSQAKVSSGDVKRMSRPKATAQPAQPKTSPAPSQPDPPEVTSTDVVSPRTTQQVNAVNADTAAKAVASAVAAATSAARRVMAPEMSLEVESKADLIASGDKVETKADLIASGDKIVLGTSLNETLPSTVTEATSDIKVSSECLEELLNPPALIADVGGTTGLSGEGQSGTSPERVSPSQEDVVGDTISMSPAEDLQEELPSTSANIQSPSVSMEEVPSTFQQLPPITPTKKPEEGEHEIYVEPEAEFVEGAFVVPLEAVAVTFPAIAVDIVDPQVCRERSVLGQVTVEALCAENQRLRDEVERQRMQIELLAGAKGPQNAVYADVDCEEVRPMERVSIRDHETMPSYELLQSASSNLAASFKADSVTRAPKAVVYVAPPPSDAVAYAIPTTGYPKIVAPSTALGSTAPTPVYPMPASTGVMSPIVPAFAGSLGGKGGLVQLAGSAITPRVLASPRLGATGTSSVPAPSTGMSARFVQKDSARAPVALPSPHIAMRPQADSIRAPVAMQPQMQASGVHSPRYYDRSLSPISRHRGLVQRTVPQAPVPQPQQLASTVAPASSGWPTEVTQLQGRATASAITGASNAPAQLPRRNGTAYRMVSSEGVAYQYAAPPFSIVQPTGEVARMRSSEVERLISAVPLTRSPQVERRAEGIANAIQATFTIV